MLAPLPAHAGEEPRVVGATASGASAGSTAEPDTIYHPFDLSVARGERYSLEVSFPSAPGARVVVGPNQNPLLANIDPATIPNRTIVVYRDGRVVLGGGRPLAAPFTGAPHTPPSATLEPLFESPNVGFTIYYSGTVIPAWGDYDNDGDQDLPLFINDGDGTFTEMPGFRAHLANGNYHGSAWCDYDRDGDRDLVLLSYDTIPTQSLLLQNQGDGTFVDVASSVGMDLAGRGETAVWGDFDNDGDPDLFAPYYSYVAPFRNFLYRNDGGGNFTEIADSAGVSQRDVPEELKQEGAPAVDWDDDGDLDLYCASGLFINDGTGRFTDVRESVGLPARFDEGATWVDIDNDGDFDLFTRNTDTARLFRNDSGFYVDVTTAAGIPPASFLWGDSFADADNDGDLDLLYFEAGHSSRLMLNRGDGTFFLDPAGTTSAATKGMSAWADYDNDGDLDFVDGAQEFDMFVSRLERQPGFDQSFLRVHVVDTDSTENQQGATVRLRCLNGPTGVVQTRAVEVGAAYLSHNEYRTHLGLGVAGTVARVPELPSYPDGAEVTVTATPAPGYHFAGWTGDASGTANPLTVLVNGAKGIQATFERDAYTVSASATAGGGVTRTPDQAAYPVGSLVLLTAVPSPGSEFVGWSGDTTSAANPLTLRVGDHTSVTAHFAVGSWPLAISTVGEGSVVRSPDQASYLHGTTVQLTATAGLGYAFDHWSGDASGSSNPTSIVMDGDHTVVAHFAINTYTLDLAVAGTGTISRSLNLPAYPHGTVVKLTAIPGADQEFTAWSGDAAGVANPVSVVMDRNRSVTATFTDLGVWAWDGGGDGSSWTDFQNWNRTSLPPPASKVVLDHSIVAGDYTVYLPAGGATITVARLDIAPTGGGTITLVLPGGNTGNPGLRVGDDGPGSTDIRLAAGAVLRNSSSTNSGNRIQLDNPTNGTLTIENGGRYVHATLSSASALATRLSTAPGTERGEFHYDVPGNLAYPIITAGATYGSLTLSRAGGIASYTSSGSSPLVIRGDFKVASGGYASAMTGALSLGGDLVNNGSSLTFPASQLVVFDGDSTQHVSGASSVNLSGPSRIEPGSTLALGAAPFASFGAMSVLGTLRLDDDTAPSGTGAYSYGDTGRLVFNHPSGNLTVTNPVGYWPASNGPAQVVVKGPGSITMNSNRVVNTSLATGGTVNRADRLTLNGVLRLEPGGSLSRSPSYGTNATLVYAGDASVGLEWIAGDSTGEGVPRHVTVDAGTGVVTLPATDRTVAGDLTVASGTLALSAADLRILGDVTVDGTLAANGRALVAAGGGTQTLAGSGPMDLARLSLQKTGGSVRLARDLAVTSLSGDALEFSGLVDRLELGGHRLALSGPLGGTHANGVLEGGPDAALALAGSGSIGTLRFAPGTERLSVLSVDLGAGGDVALSSALIVEDTLALTRGRIEMGAKTLTIAEGGGVVRGEGHVSGTMRKTLAAGAQNLAFEIGSGVRYTPVELAFGEVATAGAVLARTLDGDHPELPGSPLRPGETVNRHWSLNNEGAVFDRCDATFHFDPTDLDAATDEESLAVRAYEAGAWRYLEAGARAPGSIQALGATSLADFAIGEATSWTLATGVSGLGSVSPSPAQSTYDDRTEVDLAATPAAGHQFTGWSGDTVASENPLRLGMLRDRDVIASFELIGSVLGITVVGPGTVTKSPDWPLYPPDSVVRLVAHAAPGYTFAGWSGDTTAADTVLLVTMDAPRNIVATFADLTAPQVQLLYPNGPTLFWIGTKFTVAWNATDPVGVTSVDLLLSRNGVIGPFEPIVAAEPNDGAYSWLVLGPPTGQALLMVVARDSAGNLGADVSDAAFSIGGGVTEAERDAVTEFALGPLTPNPARSIVLIEYALPREAAVRLSVLDIQGREIAVLVDGDRPQGRHRVAWSGETTSGRAAPGLYFVRYHTPQRTWVRRLVMAR